MENVFADLEYGWSMHVVRQEVVDVVVVPVVDLGTQVEKFEGEVVVVVVEEIAVQDEEGHVQDQGHLKEEEEGLDPDPIREANLGIGHVVIALLQMNAKDRKIDDLNPRKEKTLKRNVQHHQIDIQEKDQSQMMSMHRRRGHVHVQEVGLDLDLAMTTKMMTSEG